MKEKQKNRPTPQSLNRHKNFMFSSNFLVWPSNFTEKIQKKKDYKARENSNMPFIFFIKELEKFALPIWREKFGFFWRFFFSWNHLGAFFMEQKVADNWFKFQSELQNSGGLLSSSTTACWCLRLIKIFISTKKSTYILIPIGTKRYREHFTVRKKIFYRSYLIIFFLKTKKLP